MLYSGGLDSTTCVALAWEQGYQVDLLSCQYGQTHDRFQPPTYLFERFGVVNHQVLYLPTLGDGVSSLVDRTLPVPHARSRDATELPNTYVPARNLVLLAHAVSVAEEIGARAVYIGANAIDYSGYPDCRQSFLEAFQQAVLLGTRRGDDGTAVELLYPLVNLTKAEIIRRGLELGVDYAQTYSCYAPQGDARLACGLCEACDLRRQGFLDAGVEDPTRYVAQ